MQLVGAALLVVIVAYLAWRDGLLTTTASGAAAAPAATPNAAPTAFPSGVTMLPPGGAPAAIPAFKALPQPLLSISFCTS